MVFDLFIFLLVLLVIVLMICHSGIIILSLLLLLLNYSIEHIFLWNFLNYFLVRNDFLLRCEQNWFFSIFLFHEFLLWVIDKIDLNTFVKLLECVSLWVHTMNKASMGRSIISFIEYQGFILRYELLAFRYQLLKWYHTIIFYQHDVCEWSQSKY